MLEKWTRKAKESLVTPFYLLAVMWMLHLVQWLLGFNLWTLGILPLREVGLKGILFSPLIHGSWAHLIANTIPLYLLTAMILFFYRRVATTAFITIYLFGGLLTWLLPFQSAWHIGASGLIYGLWGFVICNGFFRRNLKSIALALLVLFYFGGMFFGILPGESGISWQGHLAGLIAGIFASFWFKDTIEQDEEKVKYSWEQEPMERKNFFDPNIFDTPRAERQRKDDDYWFSNRH
jgi:membrane associated rhomboid family serine protease